MSNRKLLFNQSYTSMKKILITLIVLPLVYMLISSKNPDKNSDPLKSVLQDTVTAYKDGNWEGMSRASYTNEPYWGIVRLTVKKGKLTSVLFFVRDSNLHETFDAKYEKHFEGNPEYIQQSRNDWKGVQVYPGKLMDKQDINKVDAMSGATWSYDIFRASVENALKKAK